jgi:carbonic anhydrase/acetyltransferase-like protein (isoleucine patch superfamily)
MIGDEVTVGHGAIIHGCTIGDRSMVGMGAIVMDGVVLGEQTLVAAGSLVPPGKSFPPRALLLGSPARLRGRLSDEQVEAIKESARHYIELANQHHSP